jgi:hypothetical protein
MPASRNAGYGSSVATDMVYLLGFLASLSTAAASSLLAASSSISRAPGDRRVLPALSEGRVEGLLVGDDLVPFGCVMVDGRREWLEHVGRGGRVVQVELLHGALRILLRDKRPHAFDFFVG